MNITLEDYEALIALARKGTTTDTEVLALEAFLQDIEKRNGLTRSFVWIRWQEAGATLPAGTRWPTSWPPQQQFKLELLSRPVSRTDVETTLTRRAVKPVGVLVSRDPNGLVGWSTLDALFP